MNKSESIAELMPALIEAGKNMGVVAKSEKNKHYGYNYASLEDYLDVVSQALATNNLCVITSNPTAIQLEDRGKEHTVQVELTMTLLHSSGEYIEIGVCGQAQDVGDKAVYQAITGARKYGLACLFNLVTSDDPERTGKKGADKKKQTTSSTQEQPGPRTSQPPIEPSKPDPQKEIKLKIHNRLVEMYGQDYAVKGTLERITEWEKDGKPMPGIKSLREKISDRRLGVIRGKVSIEYKTFQKMREGKGKEKGNGELPF